MILVFWRQSFAQNQQANNSKIMNVNSTKKTIVKVGLEINASSSINYLKLDRLRKDKVEALTLRNLEILKEEKRENSRK